jgi:hypothetical protein
MAHFDPLTSTMSLKIEYLIGLFPVIFYQYIEDKEGKMISGSRGNRSKKDGVHSHSLSAQHRAAPEFRGCFFSVCKAIAKML